MVMFVRLRPCTCGPSHLQTASKFPYRLNLTIHVLKLQTRSFVGDCSRISSRSVSVESHSVWTPLYRVRLRHSFRLWPDLRRASYSTLRNDRDLRPETPDTVRISSTKIWMHNSIRHRRIRQTHHNLPRTLLQSYTSRPILFQTPSPWLA